MLINSQIKPQILFATTNNHKIRLFDLAWQNCGLDQKFTLVTLKDLPKIDLVVEENSGSFSGDALLKAKAYAKVYGLPTISQDRGFIFQSLDWPGTDSKKVMFGDEQKIYAKDNWEKERADNLARARQVLAKIEGLDRKMQIIQGLGIALPSGESVVEEKISQGSANEKVVDGLGGAFDWFFVPDNLDHTLAEFETRETKEQYEAENLYPITDGIIQFLEKKL